jgi:hypothetical protein
MRVRATTRPEAALWAPFLRLQEVVTMRKLFAFLLVLAACSSSPGGVDVSGTITITSAPNGRQCDTAANCAEGYVGPTAERVCILGVCSGQIYEACEPGSCPPGVACVLKLKEKCDGCIVDSACLPRGLCGALPEDECYVTPN